jgi:hypothetical protein
MPEECVAVVPFGANLMDVPSGDDVRRRLSAPLDRSTCTLLLLGRDWHRKGADQAVEAIRLLRAAAVDARLHAGGLPPTARCHLAARGDGAGRP